MKKSRISSKALMKASSVKVLRTEAEENNG